MVLTPNIRHVIQLKIIILKRNLVKKGMQFSKLCNEFGKKVKKWHFEGGSFFS